MIRTLTLLTLLAACSAAPPEGATGGVGPPDAVPGACYARGVTPAIIETVTEQRREADAVRAADGTVLAPARFRTVTSTRIVRARREDWFETPCALRDGNADFVMQVQRALQARGLYDGLVHGRYDRPTRVAVAAYQAEAGLVESGTLSTEAAQRLGLVALGRDGA
ncbi:MAG: peptidoglycan-binding domain-containing protein [Pseudomonadota bacterium]